MANPHQTAHRMIQETFKTYWATLTSPPAIAWENVPFTQPASGEWIKVFIKFGQAIQASLGSTPLEYISGVVMVQINLPKQSGSRRAEVITDMIQNGLRYRQITGAGISVDFRGSMIGGEGEAEDSFQRMVSVEFRVNHVTAVAV